MKIEVLDPSASEPVTLVVGSGDLAGDIARSAIDRHDADVTLRRSSTGDLLHFDEPLDADVEEDERFEVVYRGLNV